MKPRTRKILWVIIIAAIAFVGWRYFAGKAEDKKPPEQVITVSTAKVTKKTVPLKVQNVGTVRAYETVGVRSRLDSQIMEVKFHDGDLVHQGDLLFVLDDRTLRSQMVELAANLKRDQTQAENLRLQYERSKTLTAKGYESVANTDNAKAAYEAQVASVAATQATVDSIKVQLGYTKITAPITGRTGTIDVTVGNTVKANDTGTLVTINQVQPIRVQTSLSQSYFAPLRDALSKGEVVVNVQSESGQLIDTGKLEYIDNQVDAATGTFVTRSVFENKEEKLWPGMFVTLVIILGEQKDVLTIPEVAIQHGQDTDYVFVDVNGKAAKRVVKIATIEDGIAVATSGVNENEDVITDGVLSLKDGSAVKLRETAPAKTPTSNAEQK